MPSLKFLLSLTGLGILSASSVVGYSLLKPGENKNENTKNLETVTKEIEVQQGNNLEVQEEIRQEEKTSFNDLENTETKQNSEKSENFIGYLLFTNKKDDKNNRAEVGSRLGWNVHYRMVLLTNKEYEDLLKERQKINLMDSDDDEIETEEDSDFEVQIKSKVPKNELEKYLKELEEKFEKYEYPSKVKFPIRDKPSLKQYLKENKNSLELNNYFEKTEKGETYDQILEILSNQKT